MNLFFRVAVVSAVVSVVCELARKNPKNYLSLAPQLFKILTTSSNNWMLIKIIKLVKKKKGVGFVIEILMYDVVCFIDTTWAKIDQKIASTTYFTHPNNTCHVFALWMHLYRDHRRLPWSCWRVRKCISSHLYKQVEKIFGRPWSKLWVQSVFSIKRSKRLINEIHSEICWTFGHGKIISNSS